MAEPSSTTALQRLTVVQLKAKCAELGLQGISKLNKAQLVLRVHEATLPTLRSHAPVPATQSVVDDPSTRSLNAVSQETSTTNTEGVLSDKPDSQTGCSKGKGSAKKRQRKESTSASSTTTKTKKAKATAILSKNAAPASTTKDDLPADDTVTSSLPSLPSTHLPSDLDASPSTSEPPPISPNKTIVPKDKDPKGIEPPAKGLRAKPNSQHSELSKTSKTSLRGGAKVLCSPSKAPSAAPVRALSKAKRPPQSNATMGAKLGRFLPLRARVTHNGNSSTSDQSLTKLTFPLTSLTSTEDFPEGIEQNRIEHVKSHFLNRLFIRLNATRSPPALVHPFPAPYRYPGDWNGKLAFPGLHPDVFKLSNAAFEVAKRFWLARAHTMLQLGAGQDWSANAGGMGLLGPDMSQWPPVMNSVKILDDIYLVATQELDRRKDLHDSQTTPRRNAETKGQEERSATLVNYLVTAQTGDVIARSPRSPDSPQPSGALPLLLECDVRPDWYAFITSTRASAAGTAPSHSATRSAEFHSSLLDRVKTKDTADFPHGINKAWASKAAATAGESGDDHLRVAERAVLTSCMLNSFSGEKLDAMQMEAQWLNNTSGVGLDLRKGHSHQQVQLYLPESHQVLSVHLPKPPFHPSLAVVHRHSGKSEYVLRETGHVVGDEDGVAELWQGLLGCDYKGEEKDVLEFWKGWGRRALGEVC